MNQKDTLKERYTYEYTGSESRPFKRNYYYRSDVVPEYSSIVRYNANGQKIYDSSYSNFGYLLTISDYQTPGKIFVMQTGFFYQNPTTLWRARADTIYLNATGNIDSLRIYYDFYGNGNFTYLNSQIFNQFTAAPNYLKSLNINNCDFYIPDAFLSNFGEPENSFNNSLMPLDCYFNQTTCTSWLIDSPAGPDVNVESQFQYNSADMPVSEIITYSSNLYGTFNTYKYRFVYL